MICLVVSYACANVGAVQCVQIGTSGTVHGRYSIANQRIKGNW